jgi:hypothetical protein
MSTMITLGDPAAPSVEFGPPIVGDGPLLGPSSGESTKHVQSPVTIVQRLAVESDTEVEETTA